MNILLFFIAILLLIIGFLTGCWYTKRKLADKFKMLDFGLKCVAGYKKENREMIDRLVELEEMFQDDGGIYEEEKY
jgi:hypothetical protein